MIEHLPVADNCEIDVVISNCVINLTPDKFVVFQGDRPGAEPGGRLAFSDMVSNGPVPEALRKDVESGVCVGGALEVKEWERGLKEAGFEGHPAGAQGRRRQDPRGDAHWGSVLGADLGGQALRKSELCHVSSMTLVFDRRLS